jgi:hypothetical protein
MPGIRSSAMSDAMLAGVPSVVRKTPAQSKNDALRSSRGNRAIKKKPALGRNLLRQDQAYPATARRMRDVHVPLNLPVVDITAEHT